MTPRHADLEVRLHIVRFVAAALMAAVCAGSASAQSLGEIAKKEEERRKAIKTPGKVYTNDSIRQEPGPAPSTTGGTPAAGAPAAAPSPSGVQPPGAPPPDAGKADAAPADGAKKDEAYWKQRIQTARDALQRAQIFAEALQSRINALSTDWAARDDPAQRDVLARDRQKALAELDRVKQEVEQHNKTIAGIQDEARRAGVPPGWLR